MVQMLYGLSYTGDDIAHNQEENIMQILKLKDDLEEIYRPFKNSEKKTEMSSTLISKIMLGTLGCVPAYDTLFDKGLELLGVKPRSFGKDNLVQLINILNENADVFEEYRKRIGKYTGVKYPDMKLLDMVIWRKGNVKEANS